jgi:hypothetical protein
LTDAFPISGQVDPKAFPFLVVQLHRRGATGSLKVEGPSYHKALYFRSGRVLFGSSNDPRDQLGAILIESGKITPEQLNDVNAKVGPGNPLAKVLADTGFVSQRELSESARAKVERILSDVLAYTTGTFEFEDGVLPKGAVDLKLSTERIVMAAIRRVTDRNFVLRHIDGLDAVLGPTADMVPRLSDIEAEAGGLPQHLDGRRTLKEAAASARLEEFEAAKIACGLLFLGLVERVPATVRASAAQPATFADVESGNELDLGATAANALAPAVPAVPGLEPEPAVSAVDADEPPFVTADDSPPTPSFSGLSSSEFTFAPAAGAAASPEPEAEPTVAPVPEPVRAFAAEPPIPPPAEPAPAAHETTAPAEPETVAITSPASTAGSSAEPPAAEPATTAIPARAEATAPAGAGIPAPLPLIMPDRGRSSRPRAAESVPAREPNPTRRPSRPSKEDLAALDELLNSRSLEAPLAPMEKPGGHGEGGPQFRRSGGGRRTTSSGRGPLMLGVGAVLLGIAAAAWFYLNRVPEGQAHLATATPAPRSPAATPASTPRPLSPPTPAAGTATAPPAGSPAATTAANARPATPVAAVPSAAPATPPSPPVSAAAPDGRALLRAGRYPEAARAFASSTRAAGKSAAVIQLLIACSAETVQKAVDNASAAELFILPVNFKGRDCYRLCWGLYPSEARASSALRTVPEYFRIGGAAPRVVGAPEVAP